MSTSGNKAFISSIVVMDFTTLSRVVTLMFPLNVHAVLKCFWASNFRTVLNSPALWVVRSSLM